MKPLARIVERGSTRFVLTAIPQSSQQFIWFVFAVGKIPGLCEFLGTGTKFYPAASEELVDQRMEEALMDCEHSLDERLKEKQQGK